MYLLREATTSPQLNTLAELNAAPRPAPDDSFFGNVHIKYPDNVQTMTIYQVSLIEWAYIEKTLRRVLTAAAGFPPFGPSGALALTY